MTGTDRGVAGDGGALRRAKALSVPTRVHIVEVLQGSSGPLTAGAIAELVGVHHTVARDHLAVLVDAGLVCSAPLPVSGRGRPSVGYDVVRAELEPDHSYRTLAAMLAEVVATGATPREIGRRAGASIEPHPDGSVETVRREAERLGFRPTLRSKGSRHEIVLHECPFADVAATQPDTVCGLHLGLAEGVCAGIGDVEVQGLTVANPRRGGCRIVLRDVT